MLDSGTKNSEKSSQKIHLSIFHADENIRF